MKKFTYQFTASDIKVILATLTVMENVLPTLELEEMPEEVKLQCLVHGNSASERLVHLEERITRNELSAIHVSLQIADMINQHEVDVDPASVDICKKFVFDIQKLLSILDDYFE